MGAGGLTRSMPHLSAISRSAAELIATATLTVVTPGEGFVEITAAAASFVRAAGGNDGVLLAYIRHTSASLVIQENADANVQTDLRTALQALAPRDASWVHHAEGPDDMPSHVRTMLTGVGVHVPVAKGALALGTWQGLYVAEHRARPHRREVVLSFIGSRRARHSAGADSAKVARKLPILGIRRNKPRAGEWG
jgi:secondary thiamine-phosphate synthase enzyme